MAKKWGTFTWGDGTLWGEVAAVPADDYPTRSSLTIKIAGTDRTAYIDPSTITIEDVESNSVKSCNFRVTDVDFTITELDTVEIVGGGQSRWFYGYIWEKRELNPANRLDYDIQCVDVTWALQYPEGGLVNAEYTSKSDQYIIQDFMASYCPEVEVDTYVDEVWADTGHVVFEYETAFDALVRLAEGAGAKWYLDYGPVDDPDKTVYLHYFADSIEAAPYNLSDSPNYTTTFPYENLSETVRAPTCNRVIVIGKDFVFERRGGTPALSVSEEDHPNICGYGTFLYDPDQTWTLYITNGVPRRYLVTALTGARWSFLEINAWGYLGGWFESPYISGGIRVYLDADGTTTGWNGVAYHAYLGPIVSYEIWDDEDTPRWITKKITNVDLEDQVYARQLADEMLEDGAATTEYTCTVHEPGLKAGRSITLTNAKRGLSATSLIIRRMTTRFSRSGGIVTHNLTMVSSRPLPTLAEVLRPDLGTIAPKAVKANSLVAKTIDAIQAGTDKQATITIATYNDQADKPSVLAFMKSNSDGLGHAEDTEAGDSLGEIQWYSKGYIPNRLGAIIRSRQVTNLADSDSYVNSAFDFITYSTGAADPTITIADGELRLSDNGNYVGFKAPALAANQIWTLPTVDGTANQVLKTDGAGNLGWVTGGVGDIVGPASSTDNAIATWDGATGKLLQDSGLTVSSYGNGAALRSATDLWLRGYDFIYFETLTNKMGFNCAGDFDVDADGEIQLDADEAITIRSDDADVDIYSNVTTTANSHFHVTGDCSITGTLTKGGGAFKINHPLDPKNRWLLHSVIESPDMMNVYNDNVILDENGKAIIELPKWFMALNRDFRYQLTPIDQPMPELYICQEVQNNTFEIAGGIHGGQVSWQVTGIRQDRWANEHRIQVEVDKEG